MRSSDAKDDLGSGSSGLPAPSFFFGHLNTFGKDPLGFLERCARAHGDFVPLRFFHRPIVFLNDPGLIEQVLVTQQRNFKKTLGYRTPVMRRLFGQGLLTSEGKFWARQRRLTQPAFHRERLAGYAIFVGRSAARLLEGWSSGEVREVHSDMIKVTTEVVTEALFRSPVTAEIEDLSAASAAVMDQFTIQWNGFRLLLHRLPTPRSRRFKRVIRHLNQYIDTLVRERRARNQDQGDLLSALCLARDTGGEAMTDRQIRDELKTLMVAGLDTTALALSWSLYLLAGHPRAQERLQREVDGLPRGRFPDFSDLSRLRYAQCVIKEAMRLYPPAWLIGREAIADCRLDGHVLRAGTSVIMSQWVTHRDTRHFDQALRFHPPRWENGLEKRIPRFAYFPFGGGPRVCIGASFAMMEATLVLAMVTRQFRVSTVGNESVIPRPAITLQPRGGIWLKVETRR